MQRRATTRLSALGRTALAQTGKETMICQTSSILQLRTTREGHAARLHLGGQTGLDVVVEPIELTLGPANSEVEERR